MAESRRTVHLAGSTLQRSCHACAFFHTRDEEYQVLAPFVKDGLDTGDTNFQIVEKEHLEERFARLKESGVDTAAAERSGRLEIRVWEDAYLRGARFDQ